MIRSCTKGHNYVRLIFLGCWLACGLTCPSQCRCMGNNLYVYCDHGNVTDNNLPAVVESIPKQTTYIDFSFNELTELLPDDLFMPFSELIYVNLSHNKIENVSVNVFRKLPRMQKIFLDNNRIRSLYNGAFTEMPWLKEIHLHDNKISAIEFCTFGKTPNLEMLMLYNNEITRITNETLTNLDSLVQLDLSNNKISFIATDAFHNLVNLRTLSLRHNKLTSITPNMFTGLVKLSSLDMDDNNIQHLHEYAFNPFRRMLRKLSFRSNRLTGLKRGMFTDMRALEVLDVSYNEINEIESNTLLGLSLGKLLLHGNKLTQIDSDSLRGTRKIIHLDLSMNEITVIKKGAFESFRESIYDLHLESNLLDRIHDGIFDGMRYLQTLNLANNSINFVQDGAFKDLSNLRHLNLSSNQLSVVTAGMFDGMTSLQYVGLHHNNLHKLVWSEFSTNQNRLDIHVNLTFEEVTDHSAVVRWPYHEGTQIYWARFVNCVDAEVCPFRSQAEFLAPYERELYLSDLLPSSVYYVCINPAFTSTVINMHQCGHVTTQDKLSDMTTEPSVSMTLESTSGVSDIHRCHGNQVTWIILMLTVFCL